MPVFDWESQEVYERAQEAEITGFAWECLRRNPHYQRERNHQGLENELIERAPEVNENIGRVRRRQRLGGLLN